MNNFTFHNPKCKHEPTNSSNQISQSMNQVKQAKLIYIFTTLQVNLHAYELWLVCVLPKCPDCSLLSCPAQLWFWLCHYVPSLAMEAALCSSLTLRVRARELESLEMRDSGWESRTEVRTEGWEIKSQKLENEEGECYLTVQTGWRRRW